MVSQVYHSHSTTKGKANFKTIPFSNASIEFNSAKASTASFNSIKKLEEGDKIRIIGDNHLPFGGQIIKPGAKLKDGAYSYECIDYTRLFFGKLTGVFSNKTSYEIIKMVLDRMNYSTSGLKATKKKHASVSWKSTSLWDIIQQLKWLDYKAGELIECYVNADGILIYRQFPQTREGYIFKSAYDYIQEYDASNIITGASVLANEGDKVISNIRDTQLMAVWGRIFDVEEGC